MAHSLWGTGRRIDESLFAAGYAFDFFQAVRLLVLMDARPENSRGSSEPVRFAVDSSMAFPASSIVRIDKRGGSCLPLITVAFMGLIGSEGVLPDSYTEMAVHQKAMGNASFAAFFDIFHQRLLSLFYRAWEKHHLFLSYEQSGPQARAPLTQYLLDLIGMGTLGLQGRLPFPDEALLRYAGLLAQRPRSAECLRALLHDFFQVPVTIEQFLGRWHALELDELCTLGSGKPSSQLGSGAVAGDAVWSRQAMLRAVFGPLSAEQFSRFLPSGGSFRKATELTRWFLGPALDFAVQPVLAGGEVLAWCRLGDDAPSASRLGWSTWMTDAPFLGPATEAVFAEEESFTKGVCDGDE